MANIFRIKTTRPLTAGAETVQKAGNLFVRIRRGGRAVLRPVLDCGTRYRDESSKWYIQYRDSTGNWQRVPGYTDKEATVQLAAELERKVERRVAGLTNPFEDAEKRPLIEHLQDFQAYLRGKGDSVKHVDQTFGRIRRALDGCGMTAWADVSASRLVAWLEHERHAGRIGIKTSNYYQSAVKEFCTWMVRDKRAESSPLTHLSAQNADADVRRQRRAVTPDEFNRLVQAAMIGPAVQCMNGADRAMLYILASWTGYRRKELASLTASSFDFESNPPVVRVGAAYSKRKRNDSVPLHEGVAERIKQWLACKDNDDQEVAVFPLRTDAGRLRRTSKMMKVDLKAARRAWIEEASTEDECRRRQKSDFLTYQNDEGLFADFHANRHTFISNLGRAGISPKLAQTLARHSDPKLTMNIYTHVDSHDKADAIGKLPAPPELEVLSTTEHRFVSTDSVAQGVAQTSDAVGHRAASAVNGVESGEVESLKSKPLLPQGLGIESHPLATDDESSGGGIRTPDTRIMIPLL